MALAHRDHEILLEKSARLKARWRYAERQQRDVDVPLFKLLQTPLPGLIPWAAALSLALWAAVLGYLVSRTFKWD